jgi:hypothetical protein
MNALRRPLVAAVLAGALACGGEDGAQQSEPPERTTPPLPAPTRALRQGIETRMIALLRDIADAQERAKLERGRYVDWATLRGSYYPDPVPSNYDVRMVVLGAGDAYEVEITHTPSGVRCGSSTGTGGSVYRAPRCR